MTRGADAWLGSGMAMASSQRAAAGGVVRAATGGAVRDTAGGAVRDTADRVVRAVAGGVVRDASSVGAVWHAWGAVLVVSALGVPVAGLLVVLLVKARPDRPVRFAVAEVGAVAGTLPWIWMILTPSVGTPRRVSLVPFADFGGSDLVVQIGGNLLVFAALAFFLPIRYPVRPWTVLLVAAAGSVTVEVLQYLLDLGRVSSVDDVLVNAVGGALAACCSRRWWRIRAADPGRDSEPEQARARARARAGS